MPHIARASLQPPPVTKTFALMLCKRAGQISSLRRVERDEIRKRIRAAQAALDAGKVATQAHERRGRQQSTHEFPRPSMREEAAP